MKKKRPYNLSPEGKAKLKANAGKNFALWKERSPEEWLEQKKRASLLAVEAKKLKRITAQD